MADLQPEVAARTYRNAYGTHFSVSSTWTMLLGMHVVIVVGGLMLLSVVPVRFATKEKSEAPFVLWFGSTKKKKRIEREEEVETESVWHRVSSWWVRTVKSWFPAAPVTDTDVRYRFQADMTQQLAASAAATKSYESIAIATDDLESPTGASTTGSPSKRGQSSRASLFVAAPPSPTMRRLRQSSRLLSHTSTVRSESIGRLSRFSSDANAVETKEDFVRVALERQSLEVRLERRKTLAREDVSYENLEDDEMQVYEYLEFVRELLDGLSLKKLCQKSGRVVSRTLYITVDLQVVFWNSMGAIKRQTQKSSLRTERIDSVQKGLHGSANVSARSTPEREALCVSIHCSDGKWLVLEAKTEAMRQRLYLGFTRLSREKHEQEAAARQPTIPEDVEGEEQEGRAVVEQFEYEEKAPVPQIERLVQREVHQRGREEQVAELLQNMENLLTDEEEVKGGQAEEDIDNLSDDPEMSRE